MDEVVIGVDAGGTGTRAVALTVHGRRLGSGRAGPANPHVHPPATVEAALGGALREALAGVSPQRVRAGVIGLAGFAAASAPEVHRAIHAAWAGTGAAAPVQVVDDAVVAFAAGTAEPAGAVVIAGTGAVAARIEAHRVTRTVDGLGWLLGDEGSGFWLGLAAARWTARALAAQTPPGPLSRAVTDHLGATEPEPFVTRCYQLPRQRLADLAPLVCQAATRGDPTAQALVRRAASHLAASVAELGDASGPVVLAGGLLANPTPVREHLLDLLGTAPGQRTAVAGDGATGAAWLAARSCGAGDPDGAGLHRRFQLSPPR